MFMVLPHLVMAFDANDESLPAEARTIGEAPTVARAPTVGEAPTVAETPTVARPRPRGVVADSSGTGTTLLTVAAGEPFDSRFGAGSAAAHAAIGYTPLGIDPETGLMLYAYDYKHDVAEAELTGRPMGPKRVGPMAQDVEKAFPGSTARVGGKLVIRGH